MPALLRKLLIVAAVDGLVLHAHGANGARHGSGASGNDASSIRIDYKTNKVTTLPPSSAGSESLEGRDGLEAYGLVGELHSCRSQGEPSATDRN